MYIVLILHREIIGMYKIHILKIHLQDDVYCGNR